MSDSEKLDNLYKLARRARDNGSSDEANKYYRQILMKAPDCWESVFYSAYFLAVQKHKNGNTVDALTTLRNCIGDVFSCINNTIENIDKRNDAVTDVVAASTQMCLAYLDRCRESYKVNKLSIEQVEALSFEFARRAYVVSQIWASLGDEIIRFFGNDDSLCKEAVSLWQKIEKDINYAVLNKFIDYSQGSAIEKMYDEKIKQYVEIIGKNDQSYYWKHTGKCQYDGGKLGFFGKCKSCGRKS